MVKDVWAQMEAGEVVVGHWMASGSPTMCEVLACAGADVVAIDCEHGAISPFGAEMEACVRATEAGGAAAIVRLVDGQPAGVGRLADIGARGVIVPHVTTAAQLEELIAHARFPPLGVRGCHPGVRAARYGTVPWTTFADQQHREFAVVPLFEDPEAFDVLEELLDVDGLRAVAIGPFDLAARLGPYGDPAVAAQVRERLERLLAAAGERGISVIDGAWDQATFQDRVTAGVRGVLFSADISLLEPALRSAVGDMRAFLADRSPA